MIDGRLVSSSVEVDAPPSAVFDLLADPSRHPVLDGSGTVRRLLRGPDRLFLGARFSMGMQLKVPYAMVNRVVEYDENRLVAWTHVSRAVWRYRLEPLPGGRTRVTEEFDMRRSPLAGLYERLGVPRANEKAMGRSLRILRDVVEAEAVRR